MSGKVRVIEFLCTSCGQVAARYEVKKFKSRDGSYDQDKSGTTICESCLDTLSEARKNGSPYWGSSS